MTIKFQLLLSLLTCLSISGCVSKGQVRKILVNNPEIVYEAMEKNPEKFYESMTKVTTEARKIQAAKRDEEEKQRREEEFKNPKVPAIDESRAFLGNAQAPLTVVAYSDFQCPYCKKGAATIEELRSKYGDQIRFIFKHLPLEMHPQAMPAAQRFEAIALQDKKKAYGFHDAVFKDQNRLSTDKEKFLDEVATKLGIDMKKMKADMESETVKKRIDADIQEAKSFGITGTPGFMVAGVTVRGARPLQDFAAIIDRRLAEKKTSQ